MISHNQLFIVVAVTTVIFSLFLIFSTDKGWTLNNETTDETIVRSKNNRPQFDKHLNYSLLEKNKSTCFQLAKTNQTRQTSFLLKPQACDDNVDVVIMVKSSIYRNSLRNAIRKTWAKGFDGTIGGRRLDMIHSTIICKYCCTLSVLQFNTETLTVSLVIHSLYFKHYGKYHSYILRCYIFKMLMCLLHTSYTFEDSRFGRSL